MPAFLAVAWLFKDFFRRRETLSAGRATRLNAAGMARFLRDMIWPMRKQRIFTPGPTPLMPEAQQAMAKNIIHHRTPEFRQLFLSLRKNLQAIFKTESDIVVLASSGTGAMEAAVTSLLGGGDSALAVVAGKFGERWVEICGAFGIECVELRKDYGSAASADEIVAQLRKRPETSALLIQGCETSTATSHDLESIGNRVRDEFPQTLVVVDAITALGSQPLETDAWGLDVVISGSQKSFAMSPGLAFVSLSPRALEKMRAVNRGRYYFDLRKEAEKQREGQTAFTPAVTLVQALFAATEEILKQGIGQVVGEAEEMARCARAGLTALGFQLLSSSPANAATAVYPPEGISALELSKKLEARFGIKIAGGQGELKGKIIRAAHLGYFDLLDVFSLLSGLELCLIEMGAPVSPGAGLQAALESAAKKLDLWAAPSRA